MHVCIVAQKSVSVGQFLGSVQMHNKVLRSWKYLFFMAILDEYEEVLLRILRTEGPCLPEKPKDFDMTSPCSFWVFLTLVPPKGGTDNPRLRIFWAAFARLAGHNGWSLSPTGVWDSGSGGLLGPSQDLATNATFPPAAVPSSCITRK